MVSEVQPLSVLFWKGFWKVKKEYGSEKSVPEDSRIGYLYDIKRG